MLKTVEGILTDMGDGEAPTQKCNAYIQTCKNKKTMNKEESEHRSNTCMPPKWPQINYMYNILKM